MDHVYLSWPDFFWGVVHLAPNAALLQIQGVSWLLWRIVMQKLGLLQPMPHNARKIVANFVLEGFRAIHYARQEPFEGKRIATFLWDNIPLLDKDARCKVHKMLRVEIDLDDKIMPRTTLDDSELTPQESLVVVFFNTISADHVKIHSLGNWASNAQQDLDPFLKRMSIVFVCYNYFGFTAFQHITAFWHRVGLISHNFQDLNSVFQHGITAGIPAHARIGELSKDSMLIDFTVKVRNLFLNRFAEIRDEFPGIDGGSLFASTIIHSLDHAQTQWNLADPLWLDIEGVRDDYKPMAELGRLVRVAFVPSLPLLLFRHRYKNSSHPFYQKIYQNAAQLNKRFADEMDAYIVR